MSFLQPWMLIALPLIAIPVIIHLVNQRRFQTVPWAAMMFLLQAAKMSSGYTKLRQWLILAARTAAIAALILFTARPLTSGIMALMGGDSNRMALIVLDRSPSMQETQPGTAATKMQLAVTQLAETLSTLGIERIVVIDSAADAPQEFTSVAQWMRTSQQHGLSATTDMPGLVERALLYAKNNRVGNTLVWLCTDLRDSDWKSRDGRWQAIQDGFKSLPQDVRFSILDLSEATTDNRSVRVTGAQRVDGSNGPELLLSFRVERRIMNDGSDATVHTISNPITGTIPVEVQVGAARSVINVELLGNSAEINEFRIPLERTTELDSSSERGWGLIRIPGDGNLADNSSYFTFEKPPIRRTVIVSDNPGLVSAIELCAEIAPQQSIRCETEVITSSQLDSVDWNHVSLIVWHDQLPSGHPKEVVEKFVASGGPIIFVPPETPNDNLIFGARWLSWEAVVDRPNKTQDVATEVTDETWARVQQWQNDTEVLANTINGAPLPVGQLGIKRICRLQGDISALASLPDGVPLIARAELQDSANGDGEKDKPDASFSSTAPGIYFCATTPSTRDSTLARDGIVLYVAIQRILASGAQRIGTTKNQIAGLDRAIVPATAVQEAGDENTLSNEYALHSGVYRTEDYLVALNRQVDEDLSLVTSNASLERNLEGLHWSRIGLESKATSLVQEIWRWFVIAMLFALVLEAILCMPKAKRSAKVVAK